MKGFANFIKFYFILVFFPDNRGQLSCRLNCRLLHDLLSIYNSIILLESGGAILTFVFLTIYGIRCFKGKSARMISYDIL